MPPRRVLLSRFLRPGDRWIRARRCRLELIAKAHRILSRRRKAVVPSARIATISALIHMPRRAIALGPLHGPPGDDDVQVWEAFAHAEVRPSPGRIQSTRWDPAPALNGCS